MLNFLSDMIADWFKGVYTSTSALHIDEINDFTKYERMCSDTVHFIAFHHISASEFHAVEKHLSKFILSRTPIDLNQVWRLYSSLHCVVRCNFCAISRYLDMKFVAPKLLTLSSTQLPIPGSFDPYVKKYTAVSIAAFNREIQVLTSKQHPRRLELNGSDGRTYVFLLKGHEDLHQDECVMQVFALINSIIRKKDMRRHTCLKIRLYTVLPLSHCTGLVGWVHKCSTVYELIARFRARVGIAFDTELNMLNRMAPEYEILPSLMSEEVFTHVLRRTRNRDLRKMLLLVSKCVEMWLRGISNFGQSLAIASFSGYILGIGDRHLSNIMVDRISGQIVHVDFGECFDECNSRQSYPEYVPFRLTEQFVNVSSIHEIDASYRNCATLSVRILREHGLCILAMLESFISECIVGDGSVQIQTALPSIKAKHRRIFDRESAQNIHLTSDYNLINQTRKKISGGEFLEAELSEYEQLGLLIFEARSPVYLSAMYPGWCPLI
uniref:Non-specific serine/threonine protein kinase n=1 Tax=Aureoumbra lagunensis TaxID=44058 RepID=A0A7S3JS21_9STRA